MHSALNHHFHAHAHDRFWLIVTGLLAFLLAALWAQPAV